MPNNLFSPKMSKCQVEGAPLPDKKECYLCSLSETHPGLVKLKTSFNQFQSGKISLKGWVNCVYSVKNEHQFPETSESNVILKHLQGHQPPRVLKDEKDCSLCCNDLPFYVHVRNFWYSMCNLRGSEFDDGVMLILAWFDLNELTAKQLIEHFRVHAPVL